MHGKRPLAAMMIRDIAFQRLSDEDRLVLFAQRSMPGTIVVPENRGARDVAILLHKQQASRVIVLQNDSDNVFGALNPDWASEQIRLNLNLHGPLHTQIEQWELIPDETIRQFHHEWLRYDGRPPLFWCKCHNINESNRHQPMSCYV